MNDGDALMHRALQRLRAVGSGELDDEDFSKLVDILRDDPRLGGQVALSDELRSNGHTYAEFYQAMQQRWGIDSEHWEIPEFPGQTILDLLLPMRDGARLLVRVLDLNQMALYQGFTDLAQVRAHRRVLMGAPQSWRPPGHVQPVPNEPDGDFCIMGSVLRATCVEGPHDPIVQAGAYTATSAFEWASMPLSLELPYGLWRFELTVIGAGMDGEVRIDGVQHSAAMRVTPASLRTRRHTTTLNWTARVPDDRQGGHERFVGSFRRTSAWTRCLGCVEHIQRTRRERLGEAGWVRSTNPVGYRCPPCALAYTTAAAVAGP